MSKRAPITITPGQRAVLTVYAKDLLYPMSDGELTALRADQYLKIKQRLPARLLLALGKWQSLGNDGAGVGAALLEVLPYLAGLITEWNWRDLETDAPLPPPSVESLLDLEMDELLWIVEKITDGVTPSKN